MLKERKFLEKNLPCEVSSPGCLSETSEQPEWGGGNRQPSNVAVQTCAIQRHGTQLANCI